MIQYLTELNRILNKFWHEWIMSHAKDQYCFWSANDGYCDDTLWDTSCDNVFQFTTGGPIENKFNHCPYCGKELVEVSDEQEG